MPTLSENSQIDTSNMVRELPQQRSQNLPPLPIADPPGPGPFTRSPLPSLVPVSPDSLRQFYNKGIVPQHRALAPIFGGSVSGNVTNITNISSTSTPSTPGTSSLPNGTTASITTPTINPGDIYETTVQMAEAFTLLNVGVSQATRVRLYSTASAQALDVSRGQVPPTAGTQHGVIADLWLDTPDKFSWLMSPAAQGGNGDAPETSTIYVTITNIDVVSHAITTTLLYVGI